MTTSKERTEETTVKREKWLLMMATMVGLLSLPGVVHAQNWGWFWSGSGPGDTFYSYNSRGGKNSALNLETGKYEVTFPMLGGLDGGNVQVSAYGQGGQYCKVESWHRNDANDLKMFVTCYGPDGKRINTPFVVTYTMIPGVTGGSWGAYLWNDAASYNKGTVYNPSSLYAWNSANAAIEITRTGTGTYKVKLGGQQDFAAAKPTIDAGGTATGPTVLVTAYGSGSNFCQAGQLSSSSSSTYVMVYCWKSPHNPTKADSMFTLAYGQYRPVLGSSIGYMHDACSQRPKSANILINDLPGAEAFQTETLGVGRYRLYFPGLIPYDSSAAIVSASGGASSPRRCTIIWWTGAPLGGTAVDVACFDTGNRLADSACNLVYLTSQNKPAVGEEP